MSELGEQLKNEVEKILEEKLPEPSEPIRLESEDIFDSVGYPPPQAGEFINNPMATLMQPLIGYFEAIKPKALEPIKSEHKVKIFRLPALAKPKEIANIEAMIEALLNEGYCCHMPTVCNDFLIMDFSRRKEGEKE